MHDVMRDLGVMVQSQGDSVGKIQCSTHWCVTFDLDVCLPLCRQLGNQCRESTC